MDKTFERELLDFHQKLIDGEGPSREDVEVLLDAARAALDADAIYVMLATEDPLRFRFPYTSGRALQPKYEGQTFDLSQTDYRRALGIYDDGGLSDRRLYGEQDGIILHYGFFSGEAYWGAVTLWREVRRPWTGEQREGLRRLGRCLKLFLYARRMERTGFDSERKISDALTRFSEAVFHVSVWEDCYKPLWTSERMDAALKFLSPSYSATLAQFIDQYVEPDFQADMMYRMSGEYLCAHLTAENPTVRFDFRVVNLEGTQGGFYRIYAGLLDANADGMAAHVLVAIQNITTRTKIEDLSDTAFSLLQNNYLRIAFADIGANNMTTIHAARGEPYGQGVFRYEETLAGIAAQTVAPEFQEEFLRVLSPRQLHNMFDVGLPCLSFSYRCQNSDAWAAAEAVPFNDYTPDNARVMLYFHSVSAEQARSEIQLRTAIENNAALSAQLSAEKQYRLALMADSYFYYTFDVSGDGLIKEEFLSRDGVDLIYEISGMERPVSFETFSQKWYELYKPVLAKATEEDVFTLAYLRSAFLRNERIIDIEVKQTPPEGSLVSEFLEVLIVLSEDELTGHIMACVIWKDISEFRKMELQTRMALKDAYEVAEQANQAKSEFLSRMSHDIRTPMNAIIGMTAIARSHLTDPDRVLDCLQKIGVSSRHLLSLINEVLDMSKIESGKVDLNEEPFSLSDLIDNLSMMIQPQMSSKKHRFRIQLNEVRHERVIGDSLRIQQSFVNLMSNAVKYTPENGQIDLIITEKPCRQRQFGCYEFIFQDNGIGMSPEFVKRIFEPFSRAEDTRVNKIQGTGLGMAITNNLVHMMNGTIKVESELGKGSRFIVTIFLRLQESGEDLRCDELKGLRVLVADDDPAACETACAIMDELGMRGESVLTAEEALALAARRIEDGEDYFAAILSWKLPGTDGPALIHEFRARFGSRTPILIASAYDWSELELDARSAGADEFISKPLFKSRFLHVFRHLLNEKTQDQSQEDGMSLDAGEDEFKGYRVLLVEDNVLNTEIATELLSMVGLDVEHAENGREAVKLFERNARGYYDLIFMDIQMPIMNGYDATHAIRASREDGAAVPIIAMTANAFTEDVEASRRAGMNAHIAKPLDLRQLTAMLRKFLSTKPHESPPSA